MSFDSLRRDPRKTEKGPTPLSGPTKPNRILEPQSQWTEKELEDFYNQIKNREQQDKEERSKSSKCTCCPIHTSFFMGEGI